MSLLDQLPILMPRASAWAETESTRILAEGIALDPGGIALARCVGVQFPDRVRVLLVPAIPMPSDPDLARACEATQAITPETQGLTLGHGIFIREKNKADRWLLAHELRHVSQYESFGSISKFLATYLPELLQHGTINSPLEVDASAAATKCA